MRTAEEVAALVAIMLIDSGRARARISVRSIKTISKRRELTAAFVVHLQGACQDLGIGLIELDTGGFGAIQARALEGAPTLSINQPFAELLTNPAKREDRMKQLFDGVLTGLDGLPLE